MKKRLIVVLGMHRSGTSAVTRGLQALGVNLGENLMPPKTDNEKGFWEDVDVNQLNIDLLRHLNRDWHTLATIDPSEFERKDLAPFRLRAIDLLRRKMRGVTSFGVKDPRIALLLPYWKQVFNHLGTSLSYVIAVRNPISVARSIQTRNGLEPEYTYYLWLQHVVPSILNSKGSPRVVVDYDLLLESPTEQLRRIAQSLDLRIDPNPRAMKEFAKGFLEDRLRHSRFRISDLQLDPAVPVEVRNAFACLDEIARDVVPIESPDVHAFFSQLAQRLADLTPIFGYIGTRESSYLALQHTVAERDGQLAALQGAVTSRDTTIAERDSLVATLQHVVTERDSQLTALHQAIAQRDGKITERDGQVATLQRVLTERDGQLNALHQAVADRDALISERDGQAAILSQALTERESRLAAVKQTLSQREDVITDRESQLASLQNELADRESQLALAKERLTHRDALIVAERDEKISSLHQALTDCENQLATVRQNFAQRDAVIADRESQVAALQQTVAEREGRLAAVKEALAQRSDALAERETQLASLQSALNDRSRELDAIKQNLAKSDALLEERARQLAPLQEGLTERDGRIASLHRALIERDAHAATLKLAIEHRETGLADRAARIAFLEQAASERESQIAALRHALAQRDTLIAERDLQVSALQQTITERDTVIAERNSHLATLQQAIADRDTLLATLNTTLIEHDAQIASLKQALSESAARIEGFNHAAVEREGQMTSLNQVLAERTARIESLSQAVAEREGQIASLNQAVRERDQAYVTIESLRHSRSWRITAPLRRVTNWLRRISEPKARCGFFSRAAMAACTLPATFFHYRNLQEWAQAITGGKSYFVAVLNHPNRSRERLARMPKPVRTPVSMSLSVALRIRQNGGVLPSLRNMYRIARREGLNGILARLLERTPAATATLPSPRGLPRILVMDYRVPMPDVSAGEHATVGILRDLCAFGFDVVFLPNNMIPSPRYEEDLQHAGVTVITNAHGYHYSTQYISEQGHTFSAFYLIRVDVVETVLDVIRQVAPKARVLFHAPDVYFLREGREAELKNDPALRVRAEATKERELAIMRRVDHTVIVSPAELPVLRQYLPDAPISVFPVLYAPVTSHPIPYKARKGIFFLGGFAHTPNVDAVRWFVAEIWPLIRKQLPGVVFHIVGSEAPQTVLDLRAVPGVKVDGFVRDLAPVLSSMRLGVAPLRFGAGIKGKVAMSMGAGIPCVCTSIAAEGMGIIDGNHARVTDDPRLFADAVVRLYKDRDQWERLAANGRDLVERRFGSEANRATLLSVLNDARALPLKLFIDHCRALSPRPVPSRSVQDAVDVSIIVPVYNQWHHTRACLNSILESCGSTHIRYELILADDGSTDETTRAEESYPGLRVIKTQKNVGFLRNCNNAARHARGKHLLLLNNDTIVMPGWLPALYQLMEEDQSAAIVGSKLLYPDGTIQEAGALLLRDGTGYNAGRGRHRDEPVFNIIREADYISGASILVRGSFWSDVGGFDERYKNAYCEDSDLAMTARSKGLRVIYQPTSEVIHFEHQSYAEQAPSHDPTLQRHNINILVEKWREVFERDHLASVPWHTAMGHAERVAPVTTVTRRRKGRLHILYFSPFPSHPATHGNRATILQFAHRFQAMGHKVHFVLLKSPECSDDGIKEMRTCWDSLDIVPYTNPMLADGNPIPFDGWYEDGLGEQIRYLCAKYDVDVAFCSYVFHSKLLEFMPSYILKVIDTHDKMGDRYEMLRVNGQPLEFFSCTPGEEGAYLRRADIVIARREEEARYFDSVTGRNTAIVLPHFEDPHFVGKAFSVLKNVGMVASANRINLAITEECLEAIDRRLHGKSCPFTVHIAGQVKDMVAALPADHAGIFRKPWVQMHGFVSDISKFYAEMDLLVSPVTMGTGINVKTVQAMAFGMPLLTTVCGSKGIETGEPMHSHSDLDSLAETLLALPTNQSELERLAAISRTRYTAFFESSLHAMKRIFAHPKLGGEDVHCVRPCEPAPSALLKNQHLDSFPAPLQEARLG